MCQNEVFTMASMAKVTIKIPYIVWREGRPRFEPGENLRVLGLKGKDLRHPNGVWFKAEESRDWVDDVLKPQIAQARARKAQGLRAKPARREACYTICNLFQDFFASPRLKGTEVSAGRRVQRGLKPRTIADYKYKAKVLEKDHVELMASEAASVTPPIATGVYEKIWEQRGLSMARSTIRVLSAAYSWGIRRGKISMAANPWLSMGIETPEARLRAGSVAEMDHLIATADSFGRPEIGDAIMLGLWTGQRQADRLEFIDRGLEEGRRIFRQNKTGAGVIIREAPELTARLNAARERRKSHKIQHAHIIIDEVRGCPFTGDYYRKLFAKIRTKAAETMPGLADFTDQDLRDTAVTWLARAGSTIPEIASITGHSLQSITSILKHYLVLDASLSDSAVAKMIEWGQAERKKK
jgi:integrase